MSFAKYQFLPWARRGLSAYISEADTLGKSVAEAIERASVHLNLEINAGAVQGASTDFQMIGPGDIAGIKQEMIIRTEPLDGVTGFEPNYLPYIEFYDEDFPWRYTPAHPVDTPGNNATKIVNGRLRPWLALIVLQEGEFEDTKRRKPLASIKVINPLALPPHDELHLWAHTHNNLPNEQSDLDDFIESLEQGYKTDPDGLYSRILCPRRLKPNAVYHAFLVPSYETGRLTGLGRAIKDVKAQQPSWGANNPDSELPVYHRWTFRTGENFDFESLVKLLEPRIMDDKVGTRPMDCSRPGYVRLDQNSEVSNVDPEVMYLEGALLAPQTKPRPLDLKINQEFVSQLTELVKRNKTNIEQAAAEDPIVTVPFYGMYHAMMELNVLPDFDPAPKTNGAGKDITQWQNELNRDPRWRVAAGFGTRMVQENQEKFMDSAWKQLKSVLEANKKLQAAQLNAKVANKMHDKHLVPLTEEKVLGLTRAVSARVPAQAPVAERIVINPGGGDESGDDPLPFRTRETVKNMVQSSPLPAATLSHPFRRAMRNQSKTLRLLEKSAVDGPVINRPGTAAILNPGGQKPRSFGAQLLKNTVDGLNNKFFTAAPAAQFTALTQLTAGALPVPASPELIKVWSIKSNTDDDFIYNLPGYNGGLPDVDKWKFLFGAGILSPDTMVNVDPTDPFLGGNTDFSPFFQGGIVLLRSRGESGSDYTAAFAGMNTRIAFAVTETPKTPLPLASISGSTVEYVRPDAAYLRKLSHVIRFGGINNQLTPDFLPAMAYPDFNDPSYEYLVKIDKELLLPNLDLIPPNTISLLRTNQKFIESYLVGLNYEFGRELLWREYPTDMRGSYFRQFWDVRGIIAPTTTSLGAENAKDIKPIHTWLDKTKPLSWPLGRHNARDAEGDASQLVFVVRGDLLKKFPNTVIFAQKAIKKDGKLVINRNLSDSEFKDDIKFPIYKAEIEPDIKLYGFDLTIEQAAGTENSPAPNNTDNFGWFFIIAEVPGEPRFGMDLSFIPNKPDQNKWTWNDLSWESFNGQELDFIRELVPPNFNTHDDDETPAVVENPNNSGTWARSSADMATILFQRPVMIATHATEMLDEEIRPHDAPLTQPSTTLAIHTRTFVPKT